MNRSVEIAGFLAQHGWDDAEHFPFAADFSPRRYARLVRSDNERAVLMDADKGQKTLEFVEIAEFLVQHDFSAPKIIAADPGSGLVIMEDLGNRNLGGLLDRHEDAKPLLKRAVDVLLKLHATLPIQSVRDLDLPIYGGALFSSQVELFLDAYVPHAKGREASHEEGEAYRAHWKKILRDVDGWPQSLLLRDYMPDNLMDLPSRAAWRNIGLLDFQDAGLGPKAYDVASLCEVVRRDGGDQWQQELVEYYCANSQEKMASADLFRMVEILSLQRHMRILGILARQIHEGHPEKRVYLKRVESYTDQLLTSERFEALRRWLSEQGLFPAERR